MLSCELRSSAIRRLHRSGTRFWSTLGSGPSPTARWVSDLDLHRVKGQHPHEIGTSPDFRCPRSPCFTFGRSWPPRRKLAWNGTRSPHRSCSPGPGPSETPFPPYHLNGAPMQRISGPYKKGPHGVWSDGVFGLGAGVAETCQNKKR